MTKKTGLRFLVLGLPLVAIAALVLVLTMGSGSSNKRAEAAGAGYQGSFSIGACAGPKCTVGLGATFTVSVSMTKITAPYDGFEIDGNSTVGNCKSANSAASAAFWGGRIELSSCISPGQGSVAASKGTTDTSSSTIGKVGEMVFNCTQSGTITADAASFVVNATSGNSDPIVVAPLAVNCAADTATSTATATATALPGIQMQKCFNIVFGNNCVQHANLFLTNRQPSQFCNAGQSILLTEGLSNMPPNTGKKGEEGLGAFQVEVRYPKGVCLTFKLPTDPTVTCQVFDQGKGLAKVGCVTIGKTQALTAILFGINVHVDTTTVQQIRPNQENGQAFQILDQGCQISDLQGEDVPLLSCEDAELSVRFLEGDVVPNCVVDVSDTQDIAFRWNASKGSQLFQTFKDLSPSPQNGANGDGRIDIQDLQFVFGRFGSTCAAPHPAQPPFTDKKDNGVIP